MRLASSSPRSCGDDGTLTLTSDRPYEYILRRAPQVEAGLQRTQMEMEALHREYRNAMQGLYGEYQEQRQALDAAKQVCRRRSTFHAVIRLSPGLWTQVSSCAERVLMDDSHAHNTASIMGTAGFVDASNVTPQLAGLL